MRVKSFGERELLAPRLHRRHCHVGDLDATAQVERLEKLAPRGHRRHCRVGEVVAAVKDARALGADFSVAP